MTTLKKSRPKTSSTNEPKVSSKRRKKGKLEAEVIACRPNLQGTVLVIDPSSGSELSVPGFALFQNQTLIESGTLEISRTKRSYERLRELALTLGASFGPVDTLVVEYIPPFMSASGGGFRTQAVVNLHRAVGVIMACVTWKSLLQITPGTWHAWVRRNVAGEYAKSDEKDAIAMGMTILSLAGLEVLNREKAISILEGIDNG
jgi:hypothetical protein